LGVIVDCLPWTFLRRTAVILRCNARDRGIEQRKIDGRGLLVRAGVMARGAAECGEDFLAAFGLVGVDGEGLPLTPAPLPLRARGQQVSGDGLGLVGTEQR